MSPIQVSHYTFTRHLESCKPRRTWRRVRESQSHCREK